MRFWIWKTRSYIIEFKYGKTKKNQDISYLSKAAIIQIKDKKYPEAYLGNGKRVLLLGLGFIEKQIHGRVEEIHE